METFINELLMCNNTFSSTPNTNAVLSAFLRIDQWQINLKLVLTVIV